MSRPVPGWHGVPWTLVAVALLPGSAQSWVARYETPDTDIAAAMVVGLSGSIYVTGASRDSANGFDIVTLKYDASGSTLWERRYDGPVHGDDFPAAMVAGSDGVIYVTGSSDGSGTGADCVTLKYGSDGSLLWVARYTGADGLPDHGDLVALTASGDIVVAGTSYVDGQGFNQLVIQYAADGTQSWARNDDSGAGGGDAVLAIAARSTGGVFTAGAVADTAGRDDCEVRAIDSAGAVLWTRRYDGPVSGEDWPEDLAVDAAGDVYVTGASEGAASLDCVTEKFSAAGDSLWVARIDGVSGLRDEGLAIRAAAGGVYVAGATEDSVEDQDYMVLRYSESGTLSWMRTLSGPALGADRALALTVDPAGRLIVTGAVTADALPDSLRSDYMTIAYAANGDSIWRWPYDGPASGLDIPAAIVADGVGSYVVTGISDGVGTGWDFATVRFDSSTSVVSIVEPSPPARFAAHLASRNPGPGPLELSLAFPSEGSASFALFDIQGRAWPLGIRALRLGIGSHRIRLGATRTLPQGIYWLRIAGHAGSLRIDQALKVVLVR